MTPKLYDADITNIKITTECSVIPEPFTCDSRYVDRNKIKTQVYNDVTIDFVDGSFLFVRTDKPINPDEYADFMSNNFEYTSRFEFCLMFVRKFCGREYGRFHMSIDTFRYSYCDSKPKSVYLGIPVYYGEYHLQTVSFDYTDSGWIKCFTVIFDNSKQIEVEIDLDKYDTDDLGVRINFFRYLEAVYDCIGSVWQNSVEKICDELKEMLKYSAKEIILK